LNESLVDAKNGEVPRWDLAVNAAFAQSFEIDPEDGGLVVELEAEGDPENEESHAGRIGKQYKQTSPFIVDKWKDGAGKVWNDAPLHICLTNKAVQHGQDNFKLLTKENGDPNQELIAKQGLSSPELAIAMSLDWDDYADGIVMAGADDELHGLANSVAKTGAGLTPEQVNKINMLLKEKLGLTLPDDTSMDNIADRLVTILTNMEPRKEGDSLTQLPQGSEIPSSPIIMALPNAQGQAAPNAQGQVGANAPPNSNPDEIVIMERNAKKAGGLLASAVEVVKQRTKAQIERLRQPNPKTGLPTIGKTRAEMLLQQSGAIALSLDDLNEDGSVPKLPLELALDMLEEPNAIAPDDTTGKSQVPEGGSLPEDADDMGEANLSKEPTEDEVNAHYERHGFSVPTK
jgi:hypothetical protein